MNKMELLTAGVYQPGLYRLFSSAAAPEIQAAVERAHWRFAHLDGRAIDNKADFLNSMSAALDFPRYFGHNWDAFEECIQDLSWLSTPGYVLLYDSFLYFAQRQPTEWRTARAILTAAAVHWRAEGRFVYILLRDDFLLQGDVDFRFNLEWL